MVSDEEIDDRWMQFSEYIAPVGQLCAVPGHYSPDYMDWFYMNLPPFMSPTQPGNPPRVSLVQQYDTFVKPYVYQQPMAAAAPNESKVDVHHIRHAVVIFFFGICVCCFLLYFITNNVCFFSLARMVL